MAEWHGAELSRVLPKLQRAARNLLKAKPFDTLPAVRAEGHPVDRIVEHERKLGRRIPSPIMEMYRFLDGISRRDEAVFPSVVFLLTLVESGSLDLEDWPEFEGARGWTRDYYYVFGKSVAGDLIIYSEDASSGSSGSILLFDHECANKLIRPGERRYSALVRLADNLAEWLCRWMTFGFDEYAVSFSPTTCEGLHRDYLFDHIRLNPGIMWPFERLKGLSS
jgi:hypothetical protein